MLTLLSYKIVAQDLATDPLFVVLVLCGTFFARFMHQRRAPHKAAYREESPALAEAWVLPLQIAREANIWPVFCIRDSLQNV
jgi:hypothetical protein